MTIPTPVTAAEARALLTGNFVNRYPEEAAVLRSIADQLDTAIAARDLALEYKPKYYAVMAERDQALALFGRLRETLDAQAAEVARLTKERDNAITTAKLLHEACGVDPEDFAAVKAELALYKQAEKMLDEHGIVLWQKEDGKTLDGFGFTKFKPWVDACADRDELRAELGRARAVLQKAELYFRERNLGQNAAVLHNEINTYLAAPRAERGGWINCSERMPSHPIGGTWQIYVLAIVAHQPERVRLLSWYTGNQPRWYDEEDNQFHGEVTHWQKLPEPPTADAKEAR